MKIAIRPWKNEDAKQLSIAANNQNIGNMLRDGFPFPYTEKDAEEWIVMNEDKEEPNNFAVIAEGQIVGGIGFLQKENIYRKTAEIGYWLDENYWNKGITTEAVRLLVSYIFLNLDIDRIYSEVFSNNPSSMKVAEKNGFHLEAVHRKAIIKNNQVLDAYVWVKFRDEF
jgi:RimJ/RimL family protein N-acetyltransferase